LLQGRQFTTQLLIDSFVTAVTASRLGTVFERKAKQPIAGVKKPLRKVWSPATGTTLRYR
jgi:hypothetical protein